VALTVRTNMAAKNALRKLNDNDKAKNKSLKKLALGSKITGAGDDASGFSMSEKMKVRIRAMEQDLRNTQNGISLIKTASGAIDSTVDIIRTLKEKALDSANDTNTDVDRAIIQKQIDQLIEQIDDNAAVTYNNKYLLMGNSGSRRSIDLGDVTGALKDLPANEQAVIKSFMTTLTTAGGKSDGLDEAVKKASNEKFETLDALVESFLNDFKNNVGAARSTESQNFLKNYCGIILYNPDTGAITGSDAGGETEKTAISIVPETGPTSSWSLPTPGSSTTIQGLTFHWPTTAYAANSPEGFILRGLSNEWMDSCLTLINESYGIGFTGSRATVKDIDILFETNPTNGRLAAISHWSNSVTGKATRLQLIVNMHYYNAIDQNDVNGSTSTGGAGYLDRTLVHEFTHAAMAADIDYFANMPSFIKEGMAELVHGIDDFRLYGPSGFEQIVATDGYDKLKTMFEAKSNTTSAPAGTDPELHYTGGYLLLRYLAKQAAVADTSSSGTDSADDTNTTSTNNNYIEEDEVFDFSEDKLVQEVNLQVGDKANQTVTVRIRDMTTRSLGLRDGYRNTLQVTTRQRAVDSLRVIDRALAYALNEQTTLGAIANRLSYTADNITANIESTTFSESTISDADMAKEMTDFTKNNVLMQAAQSMLSQANQNASGVLSLLQ